MNDATVGVITALEEEYSACCRVLDPDDLGRDDSARTAAGTSTVKLCAIPSKYGGSHVVAISLLLDPGNNAAAIGASILLQSCPNIRSLLMCGIAGAVPFPEKAEQHVRLGDIVVCDKVGVIQYDRGKQRGQEVLIPEQRGLLNRIGAGLLWVARSLGISVSETVPSRTRVHSDANFHDPLEGLDYRGPPRPPGPDLCHAVKRIVSSLATLADKDVRPWEHVAASFLQAVGNPDDWARPSVGTDNLIDGAGRTITHPSDPRRLRRPNQPIVFRAPIGAANIVLGDRRRRDALRDKHGIRAVEMEASGIADVGWTANIPYLVIRGTCDYCDSTKNDIWHHYAALIAASYTRILLEYLPCHSLSTAGFDITSLQHLLQPASSQQAALQPLQSIHLYGGLPPAVITRGDSSFQTPPSEAQVATAKASIQDVLNTEQLLRNERIVVLTQTVSRLRYEGRLLDADVYAAELEKELRLAPRRGDDVRDGWLELAQTETEKVRKMDPLHRGPSLQRLTDLRKEAERVI